MPAPCTVMPLVLDIVTGLDQLQLPAGTSTVQVREQAKAHALNLADGLAFFPDGGGERFLRLPYCALNPEEINEGISRLAAAVKEAAKK